MAQTVEDSAMAEKLESWPRTLKSERSAGMEGIKEPEEESGGRLRERLLN